MGDSQPHWFKNINTSNSLINKKAPRVQEKYDWTKEEKEFISNYKKNFKELNEMSSKCSACLDAKFTGNDGKRHMVLCGGTGCLSSRSDEITAELKRLVAEKGLEDKVTINQVGCFGFCSQGPFVKIYPEDTLYRLVQLEDCAEIIEKDIIGGEVIKDLIKQ